MDVRLLSQQMFSDRTRDLEEQREKEIATILADHSSREMLQSGPRHIAVYAANKKYLLELPLKTMLEIEEELIQKRFQDPDEDLKKVLQRQLRCFIRERARNDLLRAADHDLRNTKPEDRLRGHFHSQIEDDCENIRAAYFNKIEILIPLSQADLKMKEEPASLNLTYNITGMANFGQVIGDISVNVQQVKQQGHEAVAEALKELTEAIVNDPDLSDEQKEGAVGQMKELTEQARLDAASRNRGVLDAILGYLPTVIKLSKKCAELWDNYEPLIRQFLF